MTRRALPPGFDGREFCGLPADTAVAYHVEAAAERLAPVYDKDGITVYHGDMHDFKHLRADVVITDPPYNAGKNYGKTTDDRQSWPDWCEWMDGALDVMKAIAPDVLSFLSVTAYKHYVRLGRHDPDWTLCWTKPLSLAICAYPFMPHWEPIAYWGKTLRNNGAFWGSDVLSHNVEFGKARFGHPTPKPLSLMRELVAKFPEGAVICDPFAGSLTTAFACYLEGRRCIAIEINRDFIDAGLKRWDGAPAPDEQRRLL